MNLNSKKEQKRQEIERLMKSVAISFGAARNEIMMLELNYPHAKHESAEKSDAFAARQYYLKAKEIIDKQ